MQKATTKVEVCGNAQHNNGNGEVDVKTIGDEGNYIHVTHDLYKTRDIRRNENLLSLKIDISSYLLFPFDKFITFIEFN